MPTVRFIDPEGTKVSVEVEPHEGNLLEIAEEHGVKLGSACGGVCACSSCHVYIREGLESLPDMEDAEEDRLDMGFDVQASSRLGCQCVVGTTDLTVEVTEESLETWYNEHPERRLERKRP